MQNDNELVNFMLTEKKLLTTNRPIRVTLVYQKKQISDVLLPQFVRGTESVCSGFEYHVNCVATSNSLPLKEFIGAPAALVFVNDRGQLRKVCGLVLRCRSPDLPETSAANPVPRRIAASRYLHPCMLAAARAHSPLVEAE